MGIPDLETPRRCTAGAGRVTTLFARAFLQVSLVTLNVALISRQSYALAFLTSCGVSALWWQNVQASSRSDSKLDMLAYTLGAGVGGVSGMWLGWWSP